MLLPEKHVPLSSSLIGAGSILLKLLQAPRSVEDLHSAAAEYYLAENLGSPLAPERVASTLSFLFIAGLVELDEEGLLQKCV